MQFAAFIIPATVLVMDSHQKHCLCARARRKGDRPASPSVLLTGGVHLEDPHRQASAAVLREVLRVPRALHGAPCRSSVFVIVVWADSVPFKQTPALVSILEAEILSIAGIACFIASIVRLIILEGAGEDVRQRTHMINICSRVIPRI